MHQLRSLIVFETGVVYLLDDRANLLNVCFVDGVNAGLLWKAFIKRGQGATGWAVAQNRTLVNGDPHHELRTVNPELAQRFRSAATTALVHEKLCLGAITLYDSRPHPFTTEDERILDLVAPQAAAAIRKASSLQESRSR
jgi:GAF domain-containing protein